MKTITEAKENAEKEIIMTTKDINTLEELIDAIEAPLAYISGLGGDRILSDYGQGQYNMGYRILKKAREIQAKQKASEDALSCDSKID